VQDASPRRELGSLRGEEIEWRIENGDQVGISLMEDSVDRTRYLRLGLFILFAAFFAYRYFTLSQVIYLVFTALWIAVIALSLIKLVSTKWQGLAANIGISLVFLDLVFYKLDIGTIHVHPRPGDIGHLTGHQNLALALAALSN
jgi:hypothetical protein